MSKHRILTHDDRIIIEKLLLAKKKVKEISEILGFHRSSIYREISRNSDYKNVYYCYLADKKTYKRLSNRGSKCIFEKDNAFHSLVLDLININKFSPEQVSNYLKRLDFDKKISHMSIYRDILKDAQRSKKLYKKSRYKKNKTQPPASSYNKIKGKKPISERPVIVDEKKRIGDWELDTVEVARGKEYLITLVERKSKFLITQKSQTKDSSITADLVIDALKPIKDLVFTITTDNGLEFSKFRRIEEELNTSVYFADPYCSCQKGLVENTNALLRYFIPKRGKQKVERVSYKKLERIENLLNNRPRKTLNYKTPNFLAP